MSHKKIFAFFGHHRCASTWIHSVVKECCNHMRFNYAYVHSPRQFNHDLKHYIEQNKIEFFTYSNANIKHTKSLTNIRGFHVIRDPRDIAVSSYFSHRYSHPTDEWPKLRERKSKLQKMGKDEGLLMDMHFSRRNYLHISSWNYTDPNIKEMKMEELIKNPSEAFIEIFEFLGLLEEITIDKLLEITHRNRFSAKSGGRNRGEEKVHSHYRKGTPGDWKNHFKEEHMNFFINNYGKLLAQLGYEKGE